MLTYIDSKISDPPGWGFSARPTISPSKKKYTITETLTNRNINFDPVKRVSSTTRRMTHCSESNQEATMPTNLLSTKSASILGTLPCMEYPPLDVQSIIQPL
jgi:hypothetical protein